MHTQELVDSQVHLVQRQAQRDCFALDLHRVVGAGHLHGFLHTAYGEHRRLLGQCLDFVDQRVSQRVGDGPLIGFGVVGDLSDSVAQIHVPSAPLAALDRSTEIGARQQRHACVRCDRENACHLLHGLADDGDDALVGEPSGVVGSELEHWVDEVVKVAAVCDFVQRFQ